MGFARTDFSAVRTAAVVLSVALLSAQASAQVTRNDIEALRSRAANEKWTFTVGENSATSHSLDELVGLAPPAQPAPDAQFAQPAPDATLGSGAVTSALPTSFDWRALGGVTPIKSQGGCGGCWSFGTAGTLECAIKIKDHVDVDLSEQYLINCNRDGFSCAGGWYAFDYYMNKAGADGGIGAVLESAVPYTARNGTCAGPYAHPYRISSWAYLGGSGGFVVPPVDTIKQAIMTYGPVCCSVYVNSAFQAYTGGVFNASAAGQVNHAVILVGWDDSQRAWIMRNSWGAGWGEGGYMRIGYGVSSIGYGACYIVYGGGSTPTPTPTSTDFKLVSGSFSPTAPTAVQPGSPLSCSWTIDGPAASNVWLEMFASKTGGFDIERIGGTVTNSFATPHSGGIRTYSPTNQILNNLPDGVYSLVATVNRQGTGGPSETNYANNSGPIVGKRIYVHNNAATSGCDLAWLAAPSVTVSGQSVTVSGRITNRGTAASPSYGFWVETMYGTFSREGTFQPHGYLGSGDRVALSLGAGQSYTYAKTGTVPAGSWAIATVIDSTDLVPEGNEQNNYYVNKAPGTATGTVDLQLQSINIVDWEKAPAEMHQGGTLDWNVTVRNASATASGPVYVELFPSARGGLDVARTGTSLTFTTIPNVPAGQTQTFNFSTPIDKIPDGIYSLVGIVNRYGLGGPADPVPANNRRVASGRVMLHNTATPAANLEWIYGPTKTVSGSQVTISGTLRNSGTQASGPFWIESYYGRFDAMGFFSKSSLFANGGVRNAGLAPGATYAYSQTSTLPSTSSVVGVLADSTDTVPETDETDNYSYLNVP